MEKELLAARIKRLRNLPQYKDKPTAELESIAQQQEDNIANRIVRTAEIATVDVDSLFSSIKERKLAKQLLVKYLEEFSLENISDKALLKELIYLEVFQKTRLQASAETFQKENGSVPLQILDSIHKNLDKIVQLKTSLGLTRDSDSNKNDAFKAFELLMKKAKIWREENQASRAIACPFCSKMIMLKIRTHAWEAQKHPFFKDRIYGNSHLIKLYRENKLTKEDLALIFETSPDYIDWLVERWNRIKI